MTLHKLGDGQNLEFKDGVRNDLVFVLKGALKYCVRLQKQARHILNGSTGWQDEERTFTVTMGNFFDCFKMQKEHNLYEIVSITSIEDSQVISLSNELYLKYANNAEREKDNVLQILNEKVRGIEHYTTRRQCKIRDQFEEVEYGPDELLETEDTQPKYLYLLIKGTIVLFKRPESLYTTDGKRIKTDDIPLWQNPKDSGNDNIGVPVTYLDANTLVVEDAIFFRQKLSYSVKTHTRVVVLRIAATEAQRWPPEIYKGLKLYSLDKYRHMFTRISRLESQLKQKENKENLKLHLEIEERSKLNYPVGNEKIRDTIKEVYMKQLNYNKAEFLTSQNQRLFKNQLSLQGYVDDKTHKRLDRLVKWTLPEGIRKRGKKGKSMSTQEHNRNQLQSQFKNPTLKPNHKAQDTFLDRQQSSRSIKFQNKVISGSPTRFSPSKSPHSPQKLVDTYMAKRNKDLIHYDEQVADSNSDVSPFNVIPVSQAESRKRTPSPARGEVPSKLNAVHHSRTNALQLSQNELLTQLEIGGKELMKTRNSMNLLTNEQIDGKILQKPRQSQAAQLFSHQNTLPRSQNTRPGTSNIHTRVRYNQSFAQNLLVSNLLKSKGSTRVQTGKGDARDAQNVNQLSGNIRNISSRSFYSRPTSQHKRNRQNYQKMRLNKLMQTARHQSSQQNFIQTCNLKQGAEHTQREASAEQQSSKLEKKALRQRNFHSAISDIETNIDSKSNLRNKMHSAMSNQYEPSASNLQHYDNNICINSVLGYQQQSMASGSTAEQIASKQTKSKANRLVSYGSQIQLDEADKVRLLNNMISERNNFQTNNLGNPIQKIQDQQKLREQPVRRRPTSQFK